ncbi:MAG: alpha-amylase family glycosyl hydrolase [Caldilineaceae bacterium]
MSNWLEQASVRSELVDRPIAFIKRKLGLVTPAAQPGMGAVANGHGVDFRVWAPHADAVYLVGSFNNWSQWRTPLSREGNGCWSAKVQKARPGDEYKYVIRRSGETLVRTDPYARQVTRPDQNSVVITEDTERDRGEFVTPSLQDLVIYELHVGTFAPTGGRDGDARAGTFDSVVQKLPYLRTLGVNAIELMPVKEFSGDFSWGYNPGHPFAVSNAYGGREALHTLIREAHGHGIAVIIDVVYNHFGPQELALWQYDGWHENEQGGIYFYNDWRAKTPWAHTRPDYGRSEVRRYLVDNAMMWLEELGADGLRWDATSYIRTASGFDNGEANNLPDGWRVMREINERIHTALPGRLSIAEDMQNNASLTQTLDEAGAGFDAQWDAAFVHAVRDVLLRIRDEERSMAALQNVLAASFNGRGFDRVIFTESHDEVANGKARVPYEISRDDAAGYFASKRAGLGAVLVFTAPGIPMIFQGQEFLEDGWFDDRRLLDWSKAQVHAGTITLYADLVRLRRNLTGHSAGLQGPHIHVFHADERDKLIAFHRWAYGGRSDDVVVVANFANRIQPAYTIGFPREGVWRVRLNSDLQRYGDIYGDRGCPDVIAAKAPENGVMPYWGNVTLAPYSALILSQD